MHAPQSCLKGNFVLPFVDVCLFCMQSKGKSLLFIEIIPSQDGRTSFEGRTLLEDELLLEDMVSGLKNVAGVCRERYISLFV